MAENVERNFETKFPYIIDTTTGPRDGVMDLTKMTEDELLQYIPELLEASMELQFRAFVPSARVEKEQ